MPLQFASLNSGSNGNCYYIGNADDAVLVDAGLSCRETEKRMLRLGISMQKIKAIFISHEHGDHIKGAENLSAKYNLPVYITTATSVSGKLKISHSLLMNFLPHQAVIIGNLKVTAFPKFHDAADPHSFVIAQDELRIGVFTDIGEVCTHVKKYFRQCNAVFLESNYDEEMLHNGNYPYHLKKRISNGHGHLSNKQAVELFTAHRSKNLSHLLLSHLSKQNNCPVLVEQLFKHHTTNTQIVVASRDKESSLYQIGRQKKTLQPFPSTTQLSLF